jgi:hypothetical protein
MIYIVCTNKLTTGGAELLHQLCFELNSLGFNSNMSYYFRQVNKYIESEINPNYKKYCKYNTSSPILDEVDNIIIFPETMAYLAKKIKHAKVVIWWLSIDNYLINFNYDYYKCNGFKATYSELKKLFRRPTFRNLKKYHHIVQSKYAKDFLKNKEINSEIVGDYINLEFLNNHLEIKKENIVCYNPKKGIEITNKIINFYSDKNKSLLFIPIIGLNADGVIKLMKRSKIYIDFGGHPGKDRMPREARIQDCVIITGRRGSANNNEDIFIDGKYKISENNKFFLENLNKLINDIFDNFETHLNNQLEYKSRILKEKNDFNNQVQNFIKNIVNE